MKSESNDREERSTPHEIATTDIVTSTCDLALYFLVVSALWK